jgi:predicted TIM-barrel fold metal-dependent hydrolase
MPGVEHFERSMVDLYRAQATVLPAGTEWFDAHTHIGSNDPDGFKASAQDIVAGLDAAGHRRALVFPSMEPDGYRDANARVAADAAASDGRLVALARLDPHDDPLADARRALDAGAAGFKLHPRAERFQMHAPAVEEVVALAGERRLPVMIHAGRGIPALGVDTVELATRHPGARLILAHAGISDLAWIWRAAAELPNLFFDTAWWNVADLQALFALVPPGHILYASDMPYGHAVFNAMALLRCGLAAELEPDVLAQIAGGHLAHLLAGGDPLDLGPAPGPPRTPAPPGAQRVVLHLTGAISRAMARVDPSEPLALALLACAVPEDDPERPLLAVCEQLIEHALAECPGLPATLRQVVGPAVSAALLAGTPSVGV